MNNIVVVDKVSKYYACGDVHALKDVSFKVEHGTITVITGKSGCGKTTLLNILGGLDSPTSGKVMLNGTNISEMHEREMIEFRARNIGFVFQFFNLIEEFTAQENILFPLSVRRIKLDSDYYKKICSILDIDGLLLKYPTQLSGGERQRIAIARSLIMRPTVVLMDEPTGNLDEQNKEKVKSLIVDLCNNFGQSFVIVTHDLELARFGNNIITMRDGIIVNL